MPRHKKAKQTNKHALAFAVRGKYRAFPILAIEQVISGDTIDLVLDLGFSIFKKERVKLSGVMAPSLRTRAVEEKTLGQLAKTELERVVQTGLANQLECVVDGQDQRGVTTGVLFGGNSKSINEHLLDNGFVWSILDTEKSVEILHTLQGNF